MTNRSESIRRWLGPRRIGAVYVWLLIVIIFGIIEPAQFLSWTTARTILNEAAISGLVALAVIVPLAAGVFDLSVGANLGFGGVVAAWLLANTGLPVGVVIALTLVVAFGVGLGNSFVVVGLGVDPIVGTLGTGTIITAATIGVSGDTDITRRVDGTFSHIVAGANFGGITVPVFVMLAVMFVLGALMEQTQLGRSWYAVGFDADVARLSGLRTSRLRTGALIMSAIISVIAGMALAGTVGSGSPGVGASYLLPAFAGAFLGATQFRSGRFNPWGSVVAVLLLQTGDNGLLLAGGPNWIPQVFDGVVLILAVGLTGVGRASSPVLQSVFRRRSRSLAVGVSALADGGVVTEGRIVPSSR